MTGTFLDSSNYSFLKNRFLTHKTPTTKINPYTGQLPIIE